MVEIGYKLASEEHGPLDLVSNARQAEDAGFAFAMISDHYHPWTTRQGESPFVWTVIGGISQVTADLRLLTGVTCPTVRIHPGIIAQAAATAAAMMPGRFVLGLGSGEYLNEHIFGDRCPGAGQGRDARGGGGGDQDALERGHAGLLRLLLHPGERRGLLAPEILPDLHSIGRPISASGGAGREVINAGTNAEESLVVFRNSGGGDKPAYMEVSVCWAESEEEGQRTAYEQWPIAANKGELNRVIPTPAHYEQLAAMVTLEDVAGNVPCGPDPEVHIKKIEERVRMGFDHVCVHQIGHQQQEFMEFYREKVLPHFQ